jgi:hypothetical protein
MNPVSTVSVALATPSLCRLSYWAGRSNMREGTNGMNSVKPQKTSISHCSPETSTNVQLSNASWKESEV